MSILKAFIFRKFISIFERRTFCIRALIPASVKEYVKMNFPQEIITKIERGRSGVEVELANDYSLKFNKKGQFVSMDD